MKIKNLLLAGLAVVAMSACSNENDAIVDNGQVNGTENAFVKFGISFPQDNTRANGDDNALETEQLFDKVAVIINDKVNNFTADQFTKEGELIYLKTAIPVQAGVQKIYVVLNPGTLDFSTTEITTATINSPFTKLDDLKSAGNIAADNNFLMSNEGGNVAITEKIEAGETLDFTVKVERAAAKLVEGSKKDAFSIDQPIEKEGTKKMKIALSTYTFVNFEQTTPVLVGKAFTSGGFFQEYTYTPENANWGFEEKEIAKDLTNITYCLENASTTTTRIVYQAIATIGEEDAKTFYITPDKTIYTSYAELAKVYGGQLESAGLNESSSPADFKVKSSIQMYKDGLCYYTAEITTNKEAKIVRNNIYKLSVKSIANLGTPTPTPEPDKTLLNLSVEISKWNVNTTEFEF